MVLRRVAGPPLACLVACLAGTPSLHAQAAAPPEPELILPTSVEVVRIEVVASDKRGRAKAGLRREDFVVLEDGKPQPIVQFHAFARPAPGAPVTPPEPALPAAPEGEEPEELLPARYVVLAIDDVHMEFQSLARFRKALERFIDEDLRPEDQVALVTTSGAFALSQEFTADRAVLRQTLSRLTAQGRHAEWTGVPHLSEYQAELIEAGDPLALDAAVREILQEALLQEVDEAERAARSKARAILAEAVYNSRLTLETLESLCRGLAGLSGRKILFLVSDGFLTGLATQDRAAFDLRRIADAGTRAGVVIYSLDTRGLAAAPLGMSTSSPQRFGLSTFGMVQAMQQRGEEATRSALHSLASDTGGFLVESKNDLRMGLRTILKDTETYYVLAYEPTNTRRDGRFRRIEVRLPGVRDVKVRTRSGYFAADERRLAAAERTTEEEARREEQRRAELRMALNALAPLSAIPVQVSADFVSLEPGVGQVVVTGSVDVSTLPYVRRHDRRQATVESVAVVADETGNVVATLPTERTVMDVADGDFARLAREGLSYQRVVALEPGRYQVRLATREDATGLLGSAWQRVEVPDLGGGRLALSNLFLLKEGEGAEPPAGPAGGSDLRSAQALRRFGRSESLYVQLYAYNPRRDGSGATDLVAQAEVLRGGAALATAAPEVMSSDEPRGVVPHLSRIRLQHFAPGDYELRVTVTDRNASAIATRTVGFTVE